MASVKFALNRQYLCKKVQYLDEESFKYKYFDKNMFPELVKKIDFKTLKFIFDLEDAESDDGYSLVCTNSHRKNATKCSVVLSENGDELEFRIVASIEIPLRADPTKVNSLKLWLKRLDFAKGTSDGFSIEFDNATKEFIPFTVD